MINNKKLLGAFVIVLATSCGKKSKFGNGAALDSTTADNTSLVNPLPVGGNLSEDKTEVNTLINELDYSSRCSDEGISCDGMWVLKQARCNDEPIVGGFENEPVVINIKGDKSELQFENGKIETFDFAENTSGFLSFTKNDGVSFSKPYTTAISDGIMNVYHGANTQCAARGKSIYTRLSAEAVAMLQVEAAKIAEEKAKKDAEDAAIAAAEAEQECENYECELAAQSSSDAEAAKENTEPKVVNLND